MFNESGLKEYIENDTTGLPPAERLFQELEKDEDGIIEIRRCFRAEDMHDEVVVQEKHDQGGSRRQLSHLQRSLVAGNVFGIMANRCLLTS